MSPTLPDSLDWIPIESILPDGEADCACLAVAHPSRCYVTSDGIVTHNTDTDTPVDRLPENPRKLLDALLDGQSIEEAARAGGLPPERAPEVARNIGRALANDWNRTGLDIEAAQRELQQRAMERLGLSAPRKSAEDKPRTAGVAGLFYNHVDKYVVKQAAAIAGAIKESPPGQFAARALTKLAGFGDRHIPFFEKAREMLHRQGTPLAFIPSETKAEFREMQSAAALGKIKALDLGRLATGKAPLFATDMVMPPELIKNPAGMKRMYLAMRGWDGLTLDDLPSNQQEFARKLQALSEEASLEAVSAGNISMDTHARNMERGWIHQVYEDDLTRDTVSARAKRLFSVQNVHAQRSTNWHIEDSERKDPKSPGQHALINWDDRGRKWAFNSEAHMDAFHDQFIKERAVDEITDGRELTNMLAALPRDEKAAVRAELRVLTLDGIEHRERLSQEARGVLRQTMNRLRQRYLKRAPLSVEQHERAGLIFDPVLSVMHHLVHTEHDSAVARLFNHIAANPELTTDSASEGFKQIPDTHSYGRLAGKWVAGPTADEVMATVGIESPVMQIYDDLMRMWSAGKTVYNPGTHVRNFLGNVVFSELSGTSIYNPVNWKYYRNSWGILRDGGDTLRELYEQNVLGGDFSTAGLKGQMRELLADPSFMSADEPPARALARLGKAFAKTLPDVLQRAGSKTSEAAHAIYKFGDDFYKVAAYLKAKEMGMSQEAAAAHVREFFPYYDQIGNSSGIKFARRVHPFLSFGIESARILKNAAMKRPLTLARTMLIPYLLTQVSMRLLGLTDDDKEEVLKDMRGKLKFKGMTGDWPAFSVLLPSRWGGNLAQYDISNIQPFAGLLGRPLETGKDEDFVQYIAKQLLTGSPATNLLTAWATNKDQFNDRNITEEDMTPAEKTMARVHHVWDLMSPPLIGTGLETIAASTKRTTNKTLEKRSLGQAVLRGLFGIDIRNANPDTYREREDFRKATGIPINPAIMSGTTRSQRARQELFAQAAQGQDADDATVAKMLTILKEDGHSIDTAQDANRLLFGKSFEHGFGASAHATSAENFSRFRHSLTGESRARLEASLEEFRQIQRDMPALLARAKAIMAKSPPVVTKSTPALAR